MKRIWYVLFFASLILMTSCLGAAADIVMRADGSGSITLEYDVSPMLESLGKLDGNEKYPTIPVGKTDFERSVARIPGLRLSSFSVKNTVTRVTLDFKDPAALLAFLDSANNHASLAQEGEKNMLRLVMLDPTASAIDTDLLSLLREISAGYEIGVSFTAPKDAVLSVIPSSVPAARLVSQGKKVSFAIGTGDLLALRDGLTLEIRW